MGILAEECFADGDVGAPEGGHDVGGDVGAPGGLRDVGGDVGAPGVCMTLAGLSVRPGVCVTLAGLSACPWFLARWGVEERNGMTGKDQSHPGQALPAIAGPLRGGMNGECNALLLVLPRFMADCWERDWERDWELVAAKAPRKPVSTGPGRALRPWARARRG